MAALVAASVSYAVDQSITYAFASIADNDTFNFGKGKTSVVYQIIGDPGTQTAAGSALEYDSTTGAAIMHPGTDSLAGQVRVYPR